MEKRCSKCKVTKDLTEFHMKWDLGKPYSYCKECHRAMVREQWRKKHQAKLPAEAAS